MLCTTKDLSRNGYDTACCIFQLIELMRTMDTHKKRGKNALKSLPNKTTSVTYKFWTPWDGNKQENWKKIQAGSLAVWSLFPLYCFGHLPVVVPSTGSLCQHQSSRQASTDLGNFLQFPAPVLPVKPSILQCS